MSTSQSAPHASELLTLVLSLLLVLSLVLVFVLRFWLVLVLVFVAVLVLLLLFVVSARAGARNVPPLNTAARIEIFSFRVIFTPSLPCRRRGSPLLSVQMLKQGSRPSDG